ncbi:MAG: glycosyltransferase family 2 protein [Desulfobulbaceae bacterium]|nr:glycosyltransferase family 2 protein [Desulfobulbaceae bacterium]
MLNPVPDLSVCVLTRNSADHILNFLRSLYNTANPVSIETIVVDNGSQDETVDMITSTFPQVKVYENRVREPPTIAGNRALRIAAGRYISLMDHDVIIQPECILRMIDFMDNTPDTGIAGPKITTLDGAVEPSAGKFHAALWFFSQEMFLGMLFPGSKWAGKHFIPTWDLNTTREIDWLVGTCIVIRRETLDDVGLLDEGFPWLFEDLDYCSRAYKAGWHTFYIHDAEIVHCGPHRYSTRINKSLPIIRENEKKNQMSPAKGNNARIIFLQSGLRLLRKKWLGGKSIY